jgi:hypothetical protein
MARRQGQLRAGTSGWQYDHWVGVLYPEGLRKRDWFARYAEAFDTVEVNNTFYHLPKPETFDAWREQAPPGFRYTLKFSRYPNFRSYARKFFVCVPNSPKSSLHAGRFGVGHRQVLR